MALKTLLLTFPETDAENMLLEVPEEEVSPGDVVSIKLWGPPDEVTKDWSLLWFEEPLGTGDICYSYTGDGDSSNAEYSQQLDFEDNFEVELEYPSESLVRACALTNIAVFENGFPRQIGATGNKCGGDFCGKWWTIKNLKTFKYIGELPLYGSVYATCRKVQIYREWEWTVPAGSEGNQWFFLYKEGQFQTSLSIGLPALTTSGSERKNITLIVKDYSMETPVPGAVVTFDGLVVGTTDAAGRLKLDQVLSGDHAISIAADGYLPTEADELSNDKVVV